MNDNDLTAELAAALKWALPLAEMTLEQSRLTRLEHGHNDIGRGTSDLGLWPEEVAQRTRARAAVFKAATAAMIETQKPELLDAPNYLGRIEQIWAFFSLDDGGEGVCAAPMGALTLPLIAADKARLEQLIPIAKRIADLFGKPIRLAKFSKREDVEIFQPKEPE